MQITSTSAIDKEIEAQITDLNLLSLKYSLNLDKDWEFKALPGSNFEILSQDSGTIKFKIPPMTVGQKAVFLI